MPLSTILYLAMFLVSVFGCVAVSPFWGLIGYIITYHINPVSQWWGNYVPQALGRYALIFGMATFSGMIIHNNKLRFNRFFESQEILLLLLLLTIWVSIPLGQDLSFEFSEHAIKMSKVTLILLMASHLITDIKKYETMVYIFIITGLYLGFQTYNAPPSMFIGQRLGGGIGGSDLSNGNMLAAHFCMVLSFIGVMFLKSGWKTKLLCIISAAFIVNGLILIQSRGSLLGLGCGGICAVLFAKNISRKKIIAILLVGLIGSTFLVNKSFLERMKLIKTDVETMDVSAKSRIDVWVVALLMIKDHPLGVGVGNTAAMVGNYNYELAGLDTHNTYLRALTDLGYHGLFVYFLMMFNAFKILFTTEKAVSKLNNQRDYYWHIYALKIGLVSYFVVVTFVSATYIEEFFWFLMFPVFLKRSVENKILEEN